MVMDRARRARLEESGFRVGDAEDFLQLSEHERRLVELRLAISQAVRRVRQLKHWTQQQLARQAKSSQSRVAKVEAAASDVSLDLFFRVLFAAGGGLKDLGGQRNRSPGRLESHPRTQRRRETRKTRLARARN